MQFICLVVGNRIEIEVIYDLLDTFRESCYFLRTIFCFQDQKEEAVYGSCNAYLVLVYDKSFVTQPGVSLALYLLT